MQTQDPYQYFIFMNSIKLDPPTPKGPVSKRLMNKGVSINTILNKGLPITQFLAIFLTNVSTISSVKNTLLNKVLPSMSRNLSAIYLLFEGQ